MVFRRLSSRTMVCIKYKTCLNSQCRFMGLVMTFDSSWFLVNVRHRVWLKADSWSTVCFLMYLQASGTLLSSRWSIQWNGVILMGQMHGNWATPQVERQGEKLTHDSHPFIHDRLLKLWLYFHQTPLQWLKSVALWHPKQFRNGKERLFYLLFKLPPTWVGKPVYFHVHIRNTFLPLVASTPCLGIIYAIIGGHNHVSPLRACWC